MVSGLDPVTVREVVVEDVYRVRGVLPVLGEHGARVLDVGAYDGSFTCWAAWHGCEVIAVEPYLPSIDALERNVDGFQVRERVTVLWAALTDGATRTAEVVQMPGVASGWLATPNVEGNVPAWSFAMLVEKYGPFSLTKIDCEGCEVDAFRAADTETIKRLGHIVMEWHGESCPPGGEIITPLGELVQQLSETHSVETLGRYGHGGYLWARRY